MDSDSRSQDASFLAYQVSEQVFRYGARYTHRVAISNDRLLDIEDGRVSFSWKDYRDDNLRETMTLAAEEFRPARCCHPTGTNDRWCGALFEADVARTVKNRAPHVSLLCLGIRIANAVLLVADIFKPVDILSIQSFLNGDMSHLRRRRAVPVLQVRGKPHHVARTHFLDGPPPSRWTQPKPDDDKRLPPTTMISVWRKRMRVPGCACARFKSHATGTGVRGLGA